MKKVRHVLGISGGKDSTALAIYLHDKYPSMGIEYYFCDTGKELNETYQIINNLEVYLGKKIKRLNAVPQSTEDPFDHFLTLYGGYLPSSQARWCTKKLKLEPFEEFVGDDLVVSYVAIRGDEDREAYISKKLNIQSIFPFRKNIWSEDVIGKVLNNENIPLLLDCYDVIAQDQKKIFQLECAKRPLSFNYNQQTKLNSLLDFGVVTFNKVVFALLQNTNYPLSQIKFFPVLNNDETLIREDVFRILKDSGVGIPRYYNKVEFEVNEKIGYYSRSRSGCFFCFFQQKIEWIWLYEQHRELFFKALEYEKDGFTWAQGEKLAELISPNRIKQIKEEYLKRAARNSNPKSPFLIDILQDAEGEGCAACFI